MQFMIYDKRVVTINKNNCSICLLNSSKSMCIFFQKLVALFWWGRGGCGGVFDFHVNFCVTVDCKTLCDIIKSDIKKISSTN